MCAASLTIFSGIDVDERTQALFCIASNTKLFTAISTLSALPRRNLTVDTRIADLPSDLLPELSFKDRFTQERITIADMLSHASGLPRCVARYTWVSKRADVL